MKFNIGGFLKRFFLGLLIWAITAATILFLSISSPLENTASIVQVLLFEIVPLVVAVLVVKLVFKDKWFVAKSPFLVGKTVPLTNVDCMEGHEFEEFCAYLLRMNGFSKVTKTKGSGDQGVDILAEKDGVSYAIQCKCYSSNLGNKPIQEVYAGKSIFHCQVAAVLTNSFFTSGGIEAAKATGVLLWDRIKLQEFMERAEH